MSNFKFQMSKKNCQGFQLEIGNWKLEIGNYYSGFTIPELIITMTIFMTLVLLVTVSVVNVKQQASLNSTLDILVGDLKQQQLKAMVGDTEGRLVRDDYGIHFNSTEYTLFHGATFVAGNSGNFTINLGDNVEIVSANDILFSRRSGEISSGISNIIIRERTTNEQRTVTINSYGIVTGIN